MPTARFLVTGRVQGVFFRASTRTQALLLGIAGVARNLDDGRVEIVATGPDEALDALERWLQRGPPAARVEGVSRERIDDLDEDGFRIA
jgi:acylphosphatase